uniref:Ciliary neurotrophic factor n=1 Tax=Denticeps clupeoides TaxID=299321 RepID=A0AAY4E242_9TELE
MTGRTRSLHTDLRPRSRRDASPARAISSRRELYSNRACFFFSTFVRLFAYHTRRPADRVGTTMASSLQVCALLLLALAAVDAAAGCAWLKTQNVASRSNFQVVGNQSISLLSQMVTHTPPHFEPLHRESNELDSSLSQGKEQAAFILATLREVEKLYRSGNFRKTDVDEKKKEMFLLNVHRQVTELLHCVTPRPRRPASLPFPCPWALMMAGLLPQGYSGSSWRRVTATVLSHLRRLDLVASIIKNLDL